MTPANAAGLIDYALTAASPDRRPGTQQNPGVVGRKL